MILFYNVYIDKGVRIPGFYYRGLYGPASPLDVFKYTLCSVAKIYPWTKVIINLELNECYNDKKSEVFKYIEDLFSGQKLILTNKRCGYQPEWQKLYDEMDDSLIFFCCNHDHVFVDKDTDYLHKCVKEFRNKFSNIPAGLYFSHWVESNIINFNYNTSGKFGLYSIHDKYTLGDTFVYTMSPTFDSIQIITRETYYKWWNDKKFPDLYLPRTDYFNLSIPTAFDKVLAVPYKELFKHFDGYTHTPNLNNNQLKSAAANVICPLFIPNGFFDNNIKIRAGFEENKDGHININLNKSNYTVIDKNGTDFKCFVEDLPLFWKDKITEKIISYDESKYINIKKYSIIEPFLSEFFHQEFNNQEIFDVILKTHDITLPFD